MIKYRFFQIIMSVAVIMLILSTAIVLSFEMVKIPEDKYSCVGLREGFPKEITERSDTALSSEGTTRFEAWLVYRIIVEGFDSGNDYSFEADGITLSEHNITRLTQLKKINHEARRLILLSLILLLLGFLVVKKRRLYECIVWGGAISSIVEIVSFVIILLSKSGYFYGLKRIIFFNDCTALFSSDDLIMWLIPDGLGKKMFIVYAGTILAGFVVTIVVRFFSWKKSQPHKF